MCGANPKPTAPVAMAETLMKVRRVESIDNLGLQDGR
jgi:hypothetical protein